MIIKQYVVTGWRLGLLALLAAALSFGFNGNGCSFTDDSNSGSSPVLIIKANSPNVIRGHDSGPDSELNVPAEAVDSDTEISFTPFRHKDDLPEPLPDGCEFLGGANLKPKNQDKVNFHSGKEADCYVVLPDNVRAEELSNANIRLMEFIDGHWVIVLPDKKGQVHTNGPKAGYIGPDESAPAKLTGIRPFCWAIIKDPAIVQSLYDLWLTISADSTTGGAVPIISVPSVNSNSPTTQPVITPPAPAVVAPTAGPIAWWKFNYIEGSTAFDSSGNNNHGRVYGATWSDNALSFDGVNDYVRVPNAPLLNQTGSFSIDAWIFPTADGMGHIMAKWGDTGDWTGQRSYSFYTNFGRRLEFAISDDAHQQDNPFHVFSTPDGVLTLNNWNYVTAVYDKSTGTRRIYVNGTKVAERTDTPINLTVSNADVAIGAYMPSSTTFRFTFQGRIDEVKIYNYARSAAEIQADYNYNLPSIAITPYTPPTTVWTTMAPMPTARSILAIGVVNNKIYAIGGYDGSKVLDTNEEYDPVENTWTTKAPMPTPRDGFAIGVVNNKIYAIGGWDHRTYTNYAVNEEYDPATNRWTTKSPMPTPRRCLTIGVVNNKIYAIGGYGSADLNTVEEYDPATDSWAKKSGLALARHGIFIGVVNNKIYCIAGRTLIGNYNVFSMNEEYNPFTDSWTTKADMPVIKGSFDIGVVNGKIYAIGGYIESIGAMATNYEYNPMTNVWTDKTNLSAPRCNFSIGAMNSKIYVIGGTTYKYNNIVLNTNEQYDPALDR